MITFTVGQVSVELKSPAPAGRVTPGGTETLLQSGYYSVQLSKARPFRRTYVCQTSNLQDIENLEALKSSFGTLTINGVAYTNVGIVGDIVTTPFGAFSFEYTVNFTKSV